MWVLNLWRHLVTPCRWPSESVAETRTQPFQHPSSWARLRYCRSPRYPGLKDIIPDVAWFDLTKAWEGRRRLWQELRRKTIRAQRLKTQKGFISCHAFTKAEEWEFSTPGLRYPWMTSIIRANVCWAVSVLGFYLSTLHVLYYQFHKLMRQAATLFRREKCLTWTDSSGGEWRESYQRRW